MMTRHTAHIFEILRKGKFICSNSPDEDIQKLYRTLEDEDTFKELYEYFLHINYLLEQGNGYFYFSQKETKAGLDKKLEKIYVWIDIIDFLKTFDSSFGVGKRFTASDIHTQLKNNADLEMKLSDIKKIGSDKKNHFDRINNIIRKLVDDDYVALENQISETYKVLDSFGYLEDLINTINIPEETKNEIPE